MKNLKRKCIVTHKVMEVEKLIRIAKLPNGEFEVNSNAPGRGAYVKRDSNLFEKIQKQKLLNRAFKTKVPNEVYEELRKEMEA